MDPLFLSFLTTCLIIESTPGPNMGYLMLLSATQGRRAGFITVAGVMLGLLIVGLAAAFGVAALMAQSPMLYASLRWVGVAYLLWLAWDAWKDSTADTSIKKIAPARSAYFRRGLITNLLNPKAAAFYITILPEFIDHTAPDMMQQTLFLTVVSVIIATTMHALIVLMAAQLNPWLASPRHRRITGRIFALLLVAIAIWLGWSTKN